MNLPVQKGKFWILDFDIENRPSSYWIPDRPTAEVTAIAFNLTPGREIFCRLLGRDDMRDALIAFSNTYQVADMVTGHYIRKHDLPILNAALIEFGLPPLGPKLTQDTKLDLIDYKDLPKTQEHLAEMLGVKAPKVQMSQAKWREANRLTPEGLVLTEKRVVGDVRQHMKLRAELLKRGMLKAPRVWRP